jgi:hypothetical protein
MSRRFGVLAVCAAVLVGFGIWLGHATSAAPVAVTAVAAVTPSVPPPSVAPIVAPVVAPPRPALATAHGDRGLTADLHDPDPHVRRAAIRELVHSDASDPATLLAASRDGDLGVAITATDGLGALYRDGRITAKDLSDRIVDHQLAEKIRVSALNGLGVVASQDAAAVLADLGAHGDSTERRSAAILWQHQAVDAAVPALIAELADSDDVVRANALESLRSFARGRDYGSDASAWARWWQTRTN